MARMATLDPRPVDYREMLISTVLAAHDVQEALGAIDGAVVRVSTTSGRAILGRLRSSSDRPPLGSIRIDRFARQALKAFPNESVHLDVVEPAPATEVLLVPLTGPPTTEDGRAVPSLKKILVEQGVPVRAGMVLSVRLPGRLANDRYEVHFVSGGERVVSPDTTIWLVSDDHDHASGDHEHHHDRRTTLVDTTFEDVGGLTGQVSAVRELVELPLLFPQVYRQLGINEPAGVIFHGAPGTGKTHLARAVANEIHASLFHINGPEVVGSYSGETELNLRRVFAEATQDSPAIIVIDEIDAIAPARRSATSTSEARSVTQLLALMDGLKRSEGVLVIGTTNRIDTLDPALRRAGRFDREVYFPTPDARAREEILRIHAREMPLTREALDVLPTVAADAHGFTGSDLMALCREAGLAALRRAAGTFLEQPSSSSAPHPEALVVTAPDFADALTHVRPAVLRGSLLAVSDARWDQVGGLEHVKKRLQLLLDITLHHPQRLARVGRGRGTGVLLHGPAGTGKSLLVRALARETGANVVQVNGPELFTQWVGESEEGVRRVFDVARRSAPCVLFFDQLDAIAPARSGLGAGDTRATFRVVSQILAEFDALDADSRVLVVGATNDLDAVDPAVLQGGRLGLRLYVGLPGREDREEILGIHLRGVRFTEGADPDRLLTGLAERTDGWSGAALASLCELATITAWAAADFTGEPVLGPWHFDAALDEGRPADR